MTWTFILCSSFHFLFHCSHFIPIVPQYAIGFISFFLVLLGAWKLGFQHNCARVLPAHGFGGGYVIRCYTEGSMLHIAKLIFTKLRKTTYRKHAPVIDQVVRLRVPHYQAARCRSLSLLVMEALHVEAQGNRGPA